jgi:uncharacterized protein
MMLPVTYPLYRTGLQEVTPKGSTIMVTTHEPTQEAVRDFVTVAHGDLNAVKEKLAADPSLLNARYLEWNEVALEAASHVGNRVVAEYLLEQGATPNVCTSAMLGRRDEVRAFLERDSAQAKAAGAHGIPVLFHAALSGDVEIAEMLVEHGGGEGVSHALHAAVQSGHLEMAKWLLNRGADSNTRNFMDQTPLAVALEMGNTQIADLLREHGGIE